MTLNTKLNKFICIVVIVRENKDDSLEDLRIQLADYVHWYNHIRIHGALGYMSPV
ncbi:IS3 family transposase [Longirhabdus pacifica]|uniref:IS3 family transposase n=1 Tax=Longirhabdus pacifica TaxID=2305227 RepID=UPI00100928A5